MKWTTADLCDAYPDQVDIAMPLFKDFGKYPVFGGEISTVQCFEDNSLVRTRLKTPGTGKVLVVNGYASMNCALLGDRLAESAATNGWQGIIVYGCVRDTSVLIQTKIGIKALAAHPQKSKKENTGEVDVPVTFAGIRFVPGEYVYADQDGVIVSKENLLDKLDTK